MNPRPASDDDWLPPALERLAVRRDETLRLEIADHTDWLARRCASRFMGRGEPFDDLLQVARIGLLKAIDRFDGAHGVPFGAFATPTIVGELRRHFAGECGRTRHDDVWTSRPAGRGCVRPVSRPGALARER